LLHTGGRLAVTAVGENADSRALPEPLRSSVLDP
jgi:hypothetical protein